MAKSTTHGEEQEDAESSPLLPVSPPQPPAAPAAPVALPAAVPSEKAAVQNSTITAVDKPANGGGEWTAQGLPIGHIAFPRAGLQQPARNQWSSGLLSCLGRGDAFYSSDLEVCLLGSVVPCVLYGSNEERLSTEPAESFSNSCRLYTTLYLIGNLLFGWNCVAPWYSHTTRTAIRRKYNIQGNMESFAQSSGCLGNLASDADRLERLEVLCDLATHYLCHQCALCQEGRELRRRVLHPGFFAARPVYAMVPPSEQIMGRGGPV